MLNEVDIRVIVLVCHSVQVHYDVFVIHYAVHHTQEIQDGLAEKNIDIIMFRLCAF